MRPESSKFMSGVKALDVALHQYLRSMEKRKHLEMMHVQALGTSEQRIICNLMVKVST